jgi:hypothetical protein
MKRSLAILLYVSRWLWTGAKDCSSIRHPQVGTKLCIVAEKVHVVPKGILSNYQVSVNLTLVCPCIVVIWEEENQLDATQCFIELVICSTCFGHVYAHHQELATVLLVWHVVCNSWLLVVGRSGAGRQVMRLEWGMLFNLSHSIPHPGRIACRPTPNVRPLATRNYTSHPILAV